MPPEPPPSARMWQPPQAYCENSWRPLARSTLAAGAAGATCGGEAGAAAGAAGAGAAGWRLATAAGRGAGGSAGGSGVEIVNAGGGPGTTQAWAPTAATGPGRGWAYWSLIPPIEAPVGRGALAGGTADRGAATVAGALATSCCGAQAASATMPARPAAVVVHSRIVISLIATGGPPSGFGPCAISQGTAQAAPAVSRAARTLPARA